MRRIEKECSTINARNCILKVIVSMKTRLPLKNEILNGSMIVYLKKHLNFDEDMWRKMAKLLPNLLLLLMMKYFLQMSLIASVFSIKKLVREHNSSDVSIIKRWSLLSNFYPTMAKLARAMLVIPYSSAPVESLFSEFKTFKTSYRNRINVSNLESSIISEQHFRDGTPQITQQMIDKYFNLWNEDSDRKHSSTTTEDEKGLASIAPTSSTKKVPAMSSITTPAISTMNTAISMTPTATNPTTLAITTPTLTAFEDKIKKLSATSLTHIEEVDYSKILGPFLISMITHFGQETRKRKIDDPLEAEAFKKKKGN